MPISNAAKADRPTMVANAMGKIFEDLVLLSVEVIFTPLKQNVSSSKELQ